MSICRKNRIGCRRGPLFALLVLLAGTTPALATKILLKDGRTLEGRVATVAGVAEDPTNPKPTAGEVAVTPILLIDDGLRRTYIHKVLVREILEQASEKKVRINVWQNVAERGGAVGQVGRALRVTPFDEFGRRIYEMRGKDGPLPVVQGITRITPDYARVRGLMADPRPIIWDMRIATSSIPRETLHKILANAVPQDDADARLQIVRLFLQAERYHEARDELERIVADFPEMRDLEKDSRQIRQLAARTVLRELQLRASAGQHTLVRALLESFPSQDVAGETLQRVRELLAEYEVKDARRTAILTRFEAEIDKLTDPVHRELAEKLAAEIRAGLGYETVGRLTSFERLADDPQLTPDSKVALAISGWILGTNDATDSFQVAESLHRVRHLVREYLNETVAARRAEILAELVDLEGASVEYVAQMLRLMIPLNEPSAEKEKAPGYYELSVAGLPGEAEVRYFVQLPPDYDPLGNYPTIVALAGAGYSPELAIDFWAGAPQADSGRHGQALRHGYITIAVDWQRSNQTRYSYSAREHHAVLASLRDAFRRFSIDTDRVYLTGHDIGGDAAWDIGLAHPDIWAGVMPILAVADRYCSRYWQNAEYLSWYFIEGELDANKMSRNSREFDRYLRPRYDATVVEFIGRGHEPFNDEIQRLFDWMGRKKRQRAPEEFECSTMRPWDNFFWWLEVDDLPEKSMVHPGNWPPDRGVRPARLRGKVMQTNKVAVFARTGRATVWLAPDFVNFDEPLTVELNGRRLTGRDRDVAPSLAVLLEDARTRGDRQRPFWAKIEAP